MSETDAENERSRGEELYLKGCRCIARVRELRAEAETHSANGTKMRGRAGDLRARSRYAEGGDAMRREADRCWSTGCQSRKLAEQRHKQAAEQEAKGKKFKEQGAALMEQSNKTLQAALEQIAAGQ